MALNVETASREFAVSRGIEPDRIAPQEARLIFDLENVWQQLDIVARRESERLVQAPAWGCLRVILEKTREHALASILLYVTNHAASGEVVARTVIECSVNVMFILQGNHLERLGQYLSSYVGAERDKILKWDRSLANCPPEYLEAHRAGIAHKSGALDHCQSILSEFLAQAGGKFEPAAEWPNVFKRFEAIGEEISYRTQYGALCLQTHDAAEDLLNQLVVRTTTPSLVPMLALETLSFSRMMIHSASSYFFRASMHYAHAFGLDEAVAIAAKAATDANESAASANLEFHRRRTEFLAAPDQTIAVDAQDGHIGRNAPCPCGSGKKYKHCCMRARRTPAN